MDRKYGWKRQELDERDFPTLILGASLNLPDHVDLRPNFGAVYNQGNTMSCTAQSICGAYQYLLKKQKNEDFSPSRLFVYYNEREMEGMAGIDNGAVIRDGFKSINQLGVCSEDLWLFDESKLLVKPLDGCYTAAVTHKTITYSVVPQGAIQIMSVLANQLPVVCGIMVYSNFESEEMEKTGNLSLPSQTDEVMGGHAILLVGYDSLKKVFIVRNSYGEQWGDNGYFYIPFGYITNPALAGDFWVMQAH